MAFSGAPPPIILMHIHRLPTDTWQLSSSPGQGHHKDTRNCPEKAMKISHFNPNQSAPSIYIMIELCYFSLDQWEIRIHLLWGKSFNIPLHCDPHLNQTKWLIFNDLLPLTIPGVLTANEFSFVNLRDLQRLLDWTSSPALADSVNFVLGSVLRHKFKY